MTLKRILIPVVRALLPGALVAAQALFVAPASYGERGADPNRIIEACIRAEGGPKRLAALRTVEYQGTVTSSDGKTGNYTLILEQPNRLYQEVTIGTETIREAYNGKSAWRQDSAGLRTLTGADGTLLEAGAHYRNDRFLHYRKDKVRLLSLGEETVRGHAAERLAVTTLTGAKREIAIDAASHLVLEELIPGAQGSAQEAKQDIGHDAGQAAAKGDHRVSDDDRVSYDDYRTVDGVAEPYRIEFAAPDHDWVVAVTRVLHNPVVSEGVFAFPAAAGRPLPDIAELLRAVDKNQKAIDKLVEQYTCDKTSEEFEVDSHGASKSQVIKEYQVFYLDGDEVDRLVKKDGKELSAAEQQKENEHIQKVVERYEARQAKEAKQGGKDPKKDDDDLTVSDFLRIDRFTNPRREVFRGHEVIVFDFEPNPDYKPVKAEDRFVHELSGAVWIDEQAADVARLEAYLNSSFKMAGGLFASVRKGSAVVFEQSRINDEVWMPSYLEAHVNARLLLVKGMSGNFVQRYSNYQKFRVETVTRQAPPKSN
jgi:hypothetical protein